MMETERSLEEVYGYHLLVSVAKALGGSAVPEFVRSLQDNVLKRWAWNTLQHLNDDGLASLVRRAMGRLV
jgi:hypothetical protein